MNITWFIGNGLDIRLGMPTRYSDFANYRLPKEFTDASQGDKVLQQRRNKEIKRISRLKVPRSNQNLELLFLLKYQEEKWSDLELCLGDFTDEVFPREMEEFYPYINKTIQDYLIEVENTISPDLDKDEKEAFVRSLIDPAQHFPPMLNRQIKALVGPYTSLQCSIITFNYTSTCESMTTFGWNGNCDLQEPIHIHRQLKDNCLLFGLDNVEQIKNLGMRGDENICDLIVKPKGNRLLGNDVELRVSQIIDKTEVFCFFGLSLGQTDLTWWHLIGERLRSDNSVLVLFFEYDASATHLSDLQYGRLERESRTKYINIFGLEGREENYRDRIFVKINSREIFPSREMQQLPQMHNN